MKVMSKPQSGEHPKRNIKKLAVGYVRVSTEGQGTNGISLEAQKQAIRGFADNAGYDLVEIYEDVASGMGEKSYTARSGLREALNFAAREQAQVIVWDWDRLSRFGDFSGQIEAVLPDLDRVVCAKEGNTLADAAKEATLLHNEHVGKEISQRTKDGMARKRSEGVVYGNPEIKELQPRGTLAASQKAEQLAKDIANALRGHPARFSMTYKKLADFLNGINLRTGHGKAWDASRVRAPGKRARALLQDEEKDAASGMEGYENDPRYGAF